MLTNCISIRFSSKWCINFAPHYVFDTNGCLYNMKRGKIVNKTLKGYTIGYNIGGKFYSLTKLREYIIKIKIEECPF